MGTLYLPNMAPYNYLPAIKDMSSGSTTYLVTENTPPESIEETLGITQYVPDGEWWGSEQPLLSALEINKVATIPSALVGESVTTSADILQFFESYSDGAVNFAGLLTAVSAKNTIGYVATALGFSIAKNAYEENAELWDNMAKAVFGDTLREKDVATPVLIKDGKTYFPEKMINRLKDQFVYRKAASRWYNPFTTNATLSVNVYTLMSFSTFLDTILEYIEQKIGKRYTLYIPEDKREKYDRIINNKNMLFHARPQWTSNNVLSYLFFDFMLANNPYGDHVKATQLSGAYYYLGGFGVNAGDPISDVNSDKTSALSFYPDSVNKLQLNLVSISEYTSETKSENITFPVGQSYSSDYMYLSNVNLEKGGITGFTATGQEPTVANIDRTYPNWKAKSVGFPAKVGTDDKELWYPLTIPDAIPWADGYTGTQEKAQEGELTDERTKTKDEVLDNTLPDTIVKPDAKTDIIPNPAPSPLPTIPSNVPSVDLGLAQLYNPTLAQLKNFSRWLWGVDFDIELLKKLFADPMQAIIGLHAIYATPVEGGTSTIQVGYINSGVASQVVKDQFTTINCGTVHIPESYGDVRDYSPYTKVNIYLPFIGIRELNTDDIMGADVTVTYKVDVLTGACIALISVKSKYVNGILYSFTGNCAIQLPISAGGYMQTIVSLLGAVGSTIAGGVAGGVAGAIGAGAAGVSGIQKTNVNVSGSLSGNAGAMGVKTPYITIRRPQKADAARFNEFYGYPANVYVNLSQISGYCRIKDINLSVAGATEEEQQEIVALLKEGVIM